MPNNWEIAYNIWANADDTFQARIPQPTQDNLSTWGLMLTKQEYQAQYNQFLDALINRIGLVLIKDNILNNKLSQFKRGELAFGTDIEEIFVDIIKGEAFDTAPMAQPNPFQKNLPNVYSQFHRLQRQDKYRTTVQHDSLRHAFLNDGGLNNLAEKIVSQLTSSDAYDEWLLMKEVFPKYINQTTQPILPGQLIQLTIDPTTPAGIRDFYIKLKQTAKGFKFANRFFNPAEVMRTNDATSSTLFMDATFTPYMDVEVLAYAFNQGKLETPMPIFELDDFGSVPNVIAILASNDWWMIYDQLLRMESIFNPDGLYTNYILHHWQLFAASNFEQVAIFTTA